MARYSLFLLLFFPILITGGCYKSLDREKEISELINTDRQFSRLSDSLGTTKAFLEYIDEEGVLFRRGRMPVSGKPDVAAYFAGLTPSENRLLWEPIFAEVSRSGDLGYTYGTYQVIGPRGNVSGEGTYVSIWKKQSDGKWKFVLDIGNEGLGNQILE